MECRRKIYDTISDDGDTCCRYLWFYSSSCCTPLTQVNGNNINDVTTSTNNDPSLLDLNTRTQNHFVVLPTCYWRNSRRGKTPQFPQLFWITRNNKQQSSAGLKKAFHVLSDLYGVEGLFQCIDPILRHSPSLWINHFWAKHFIIICDKPFKASTIQERSDLNRGISVWPRLPEQSSWHERSHRR